MMKKNTKNSAAKKLIPAAGMLLLSTAMLATSTFAWFTLNRTVSLTSMQVKAKAEGGLLVSEKNTAGGAGWDDLATFDVSGEEPVQLYPASSYNSAAWWHANSKASDNEAGNTSASATSTYRSGDYEDITSIATANIGTAAANTTAAGTVHYIDSDTSNSYSNGEGYYMQYTYYLKSSATEAVTLGTASGAKNLQISVPPVSATNATSANLDKSLRVGVVLNNRFYIFAPVTGYDTEYFVTTNATGTANEAATVYAAATNVATDLASLQPITAQGIPVQVYVWFEGEDANCKSENLTATLDELDVTVEFKLVDLTATATAGGVAIS